MAVNIPRRTRWLAAGILGWSSLLAPGSVSAFSEPRSYLDGAAEGGGGGRWFTGSPAEGYGCDVCHTGSPTQRLYPLHSEGFPTAGYKPGQTYELRLAWPEFAAWDKLVRQAGANPTSMGIVAEFVAESGIGSGVVEILRKGASDPELCMFPPKSISASIYSVVPGEDPVESARCEAASIGERCLVTVKACGAQELRFSWTAPPQYDDSVWFAAGFVATDDLSGTPDSDSVAGIAGPLQPMTSASTGYQSDLRNDCSVARSLTPPGRSRWAMFGCAAVLVTVLARARRPRPARKQTS